MNERLPYEEMDRQFNDLRLPDEEASWQKMKELLDDDDDDRIVPPILFRSCMGWGILLLIGLTVAWLIVRPEKWWSGTVKEKPTFSTNTTPQKQSSKENSDEKKNKILDQNTENGNPVIPTTTSSEPLREKIEAKNTVIDKQNQKRSLLESPHQNKEETVPTVIEKKSQTNQSPKKKPVLKKEDEDLQQTNRLVENKITAENRKAADSNKTNQQAVPVTDTAGKNNIGQVKDSTNPGKAKPSPQKFFLIAGIGEQQQIPVAGQTAVPYSHYGRKGSLSDYVPSVFIQLQKEKKWFVQGEFRYGAAQSVKEFSYNRKTQFDSLSKNITITNMRLKKTYYHQLPFSFNYYVIPNLSVGVGGMYSRFYAAITEKETTIFNTLTQSVSSTKQIIPIKHFTDSFLYKTQVHVLLQADYQWKKFSFGLRYTKDIQPYIKYTKPDGTVDEEKNESLQFMVRYRLWQSKKF